MHIKIETSQAKLTADLTEDQVAEILGLVLEYTVGLENSVPSEPKTPAPVVETAPAPVKPVQTKVTKPAEPQKIELKGFLYLKCEKCGKFKGFMPKNPISKYRCDCGHVTELNDVVVMKVNCKCGQKFKYLTNATETTVSIDCINCGSPVDLEYHERKQEYLTIDCED